MSTTVIDTLSWCKHNVFASSMMQMQCICIIMTILESWHHHSCSQLQFKSTIQCPSYSYIGAGGTHYASKFIDPHGSQDQPSAQEFTKYMGSSPQLLHLNQRPWWGCGPTNGRRCSTHPGSAQSVQPRAGAWTRNPPRCTHGTIHLGTASIEDSDVPCEQCDQFKKNDLYWWQNNVFVLDIINCYVSLIHIMWFEYFVITYYVILICYYYVLCMRNHNG